MGVPNPSHPREQTFLPGVCPFHVVDDAAHGFIDQVATWAAGRADGVTWLGAGASTASRPVISRPLPPAQAPHQQV